jgi:hypothetical protein
MAEKLPTLAFVTPTYGPIHRRVYESHLAAVGSLAKNGIICEPKSIIVTGKMGLASASNEIVRGLLATKPDYAMWVEQDMILPANSIVNLLEHAMKYDLDVLSGVYFLRGSGQPCLFRKLKTGANKYAHAQVTTFPKNSIFELKGTPGVGCVLFKTSIFEKLQEPWWDDQEGACGQDIYFYTHLLEAGVKVWVDSSVICDQIDDDEPKVWSTKDYDEWLKTHGGGGFIHSFGNCISLEGEKQNGDSETSKAP